MEVEVLAKLDKKCLKDYLIFNFTHRRFFKIFVVILSIAVVFMLASIITAFVKNEVTFATFLPVIVLAIMFVIYFILFIYMVNSQYKKNKASSGVNVRYLFTDKFLFVNDERSDIYRGMRIKYNQFFSIYENSKYFYLYIDQQRAYILPKDKFTKGTYTDLRSLLRDRIVCVYNQKCK